MAYFMDALVVFSCAGAAGAIGGPATLNAIELVRQGRSMLNS
jgi:hypothetical protein